MTALRDSLSVELANKVERYGVVVWDDRAGAYGSVVADVLPDNTEFHRYVGSWFTLRRELESLLANAEAPRLVVYVGEPPPDPDPIEEVHALGTTFRQKLGTLLSQVMAGQLTEQRIDELSRQCTTLAELETALDGGDSSVDARLISLLGKSSSADVVAEVIAGNFDAELEEAGLWDAVATTIEQAVGLIAPDDSEAVRQSVSRHVLLTCVGSACDLPSELSEALLAVSPAQRKTCIEVIEKLQSRSRNTYLYVEAAGAVDADLHLAALLQWQDSMLELDAVSSIDHLALDECIRRIEAGDHENADDLATERLKSSWWLGSASPERDSKTIGLMIVQALARLGIAVSAPMPAISSVAELRDWYVEAGWSVDSAYRRMEQLRMTAGEALGALDDLFIDARKRYEVWLDDMLHVAADAMSVPTVPEVELQRMVHRHYVASNSQRTAYILVDALRYELGVALATRLQSTGADVSLTSAIGTPPTITPVGMAAVLPGAELDFEVLLSDSSRLDVSVAGSKVGGVDDRVAAMGNAHGKVADLLLDDVAQLTSKELGRALNNKAIVLVRSTEIDADGETDQLAASWNSFDSILDLLQTAVAKLLHAGIERVVLTADHGFLAVRQLGEDRRIEKPSTGTGELHRRAWIGRGGTATASTVKVPMSSFGISSDLDIITPRGLSLIHI